MVHDASIVEVVVTVLSAITAGGVYGLVWFARSRMKHGEGFDRKKFAATLIVAAGCGVALAYNGQLITEGRIATKLSTYAGVIVIVEGLLKTFYDWLRNGGSGGD